MSRIPQLNLPNLSSSSSARADRCERVQMRLVDPRLSNFVALPHLLRCSDCRRFRRLLREQVRDLDEVLEPAPPPELRKRTLDAIRREHAERGEGRP